MSQIIVVSPVYLAEDFCKIFYSRMINGVNTIVDLFTVDALCTVDNEEIIGGYNLMLRLTAMGIHHFEYYSITGASQPILNTNSFIVTTSGTLCGVSFWNIKSSYLKFTETFRFELINGKYYIVNYILKTML